MSTRPAAPAEEAVPAASAAPDASGEIVIADGLTKRIVEEGHGPKPTHRADVTGEKTRQAHREHNRASAV
jgi:hypothetical protein